MKRVFTLLLLAFTGVTSLASAAGISGIYSNMRYEEQAGDLVGHELFIYPGCGKYCVLVQIARGGAPYSELLSLTVKEDKIEFTLSEEGVYSGASFSGVVHSSKIIGEFKMNSGKFSVEFKRGKSYWQ